jgi:toxin ParE1/3/4
MSVRGIRIVLSQLAENDLANIAAWTAENFGQRQAAVYIDALLDTIDELSANEPPRSKARDEIAIGLRTLHMAKRGRTGRHFLVYKRTDDLLIIVRILHDSMEVSNHLPDVESQ